MFTLHTLQNKSGMKVAVTNFGARIVSLFVPDRDGNIADVVLGYDDVNDYETGDPYFGAIIGRYGNRIANGRFTIDGKSYSLTANNGDNALHGGPAGFHNVVWSVDEKSITGNSISLTYLSKDKEEGYPGNLNVRVTYLLTDHDELSIRYSAATDQTTIINLTSHAYFNLAGEGNGDILDHVMMINADRFTPIDSRLIPTGEKKSVAGTPFDFRAGRKVGEAIDANDDQLNWAGGYDHNWILNKKDNELSLAASVTDAGSGRSMDVYTTEPGLQFYTGNFLEGKAPDIGKGKKPYPSRSAFCLEAQHFPDSPNHPDFPTVVLRPGEEYFQETKYAFRIAAI